MQIADQPIATSVWTTDHGNSLIRPFPDGDVFHQSLVAWCMIFSDNKFTQWMKLNGKTQAEHAMTNAASVFPRSCTSRCTESLSLKHRLRFAASNLIGSAWLWSYLYCAAQHVTSETSLCCCSTTNACCQVCQPYSDLPPGPMLKFHLPMSSWSLWWRGLLPAPPKLHQPAPAKRVATQMNLHWHLVRLLQHPLFGLHALLHWQVQKLSNYCPKVWPLA